MASAIKAGRVCIRPHPVLGFVFLAGAALLAAPAAAQEPGPEHETHDARSEELIYRHVVSFFGGLATYTDVGTTGGAMGISYAYKFSHKWSAGLKLEYVTSSIERDIVGLLAVAFEPVERVELAVGFGAEQASVDDAEESEIHTEREWEGLLRLTAAYVFPLRPGVSLSPEFNTDISASRVTLVYGLLFSVGL